MISWNDKHQADEMFNQHAIITIFSADLLLWSHMLVSVTAFKMVLEAIYNLTHEYERRRLNILYIVAHINADVILVCQSLMLVTYLRNQVGLKLVFLFLEVYLPRTVQ